MEHMSFEERNLVERRTFHRIQQQLKYCRIAILVLITVGLIDVVLKLTHSIQKYSDLSPHVTRSSSHNRLTQEMQGDVYNTALACLFFVVNAFGAVALLIESFLLISAFALFNTGIFLLSFAGDTSLPHGLLFKLILLFILQLTILFFLLMRSRRLS